MFNLYSFAFTGLVRFEIYGKLFGQFYFFSLVKIIWQNFYPI